MSIQELEVAFRDVFNPQPLLGKLGYVVGGVASVQTSDPALYNVRLDDGRFITAYHNNAVAPDFDRSVKLTTEVRDGKQVFVILGVAGGADGGNPGVSAHSHSRASGMYFEIDTWLISGFRVTPGTTALTVQVGPGWYWYAGARYWFTGTVIDITAEIPGSSNQHGWTTLSFNPDDETFTLTSGTAQSVALQLLEANVPSAPDDERELVALKLTNGMTELLDSYIVDMRSILGRVDHLHSGAVSVITISGGVAVGGLGSYFALAAETGTADDLDTLTLSGPARMIVLQADAGHTISLKHSTGNVEMNGAADFALSGDKTLALFWDGTNLADVGIGGGSSPALTTKGDLLTRTASAETRLPVGADGYVLTADSAQPEGIKWAAGGGAAYYQTVRNNGSAQTQRAALNAIPGANITFNFNDDVVNNETEWTINSTATPGGGAPPSICEGRLTLTSGTPITTTDVTGAGTVYFAPWRGNYVGLYNGSAWELLAFTELSISLSGLLPHSIHDMFMYNNSGTPTLELTAWTAGATGAITGATNATPIVITSTAHGLATGDIVTISGVGGNTAANGTFRVTNLTANTFSLQTLAANANVAGSGAYTSGGNWYKANYVGTRATTITTQDGVSVQSGDATRRLLGTVRITSTAGQTEDSVARRLVANLLNSVPRDLRVNEAADSWSYGTAAWRPVNNSLLNRVEAVFCEPRHIIIEAIHNANRVNGNHAATGIDVDGFAGDDGQINGWVATGNASMHARYRGYQTEGFHYFQQMEITNGASNTFYGDFGSSYPKTGMSGEVWG